MRLSVLKYPLAFVAITTVFSACSKDEETAAGSAYAMPKITGSVGAAGAASIRPKSTSLLLSDTSSCSGCTSSSAQQAFFMAGNFVNIGKAADGFGCITQALVNGGYVKTDGTESVMAMPDGSFKVKITAQVTGSTITSYTLHTCEGAGATQNSQYNSGTVGADGATTITMKMDETRKPTAGTYKAYITVSGNFQAGTWQDKSLVMEFSGSGVVDKYGITQGADTMILKGTTDSTTDYQVYSKFKLLGNSPATYAMDEGSAKMSVNGGADTNESWDSNGNTGGSAYASDVASGTYYGTPTFTGTISGSESWDCSNGSATPIDMSTVSMPTQLAIQACFE